MTTTVLQQSLQQHLTERRAQRRLLLPYVTAGLCPDWIELVEAVIEAGADAVEIGIPFSDPAIDGTTIQEASVVALEAGMTPARALSELREREFAVPLVAMTHYNLVYRYGHERFAADLVAAGGWGTILPDLPMEHASEWNAAADEAGIENVLLVAPGHRRRAHAAHRRGGQRLRLRGLHDGGRRAPARVSTMRRPC